MIAPSESLPTDLAAAHAMILALRARLVEAERERSCFRLEVERLKLLLAKARRAHFGQTSERGKQLVEQLELAIADLEETQAEIETKAEIAITATARRPILSDRSPARRPCPIICRASGSYTPRLASAASAAARGFASSARLSQRRWSASRAAGRSCSTCARR